MPTLGDLIDHWILRVNVLATVFIGVYQAVSRVVVAEGEGVIYVPWGEFGRIVFIAESPFVDDELGNRAPIGIRYYVATAAPDQETAMRYLTYITGRIHTLLQLSANAAALQPQLRLMTVWRTGVVPFRELVFEPEIAHPINSRILDPSATQQLWSRGWLNAEERIDRAAHQYELAFRRLHQNEPPVALGHLYMGVEALTKAVIRFECEARQIDEVEFAASLGITADDERFHSHLETLVRSDIIFQGDVAAYRAAKALSDGLEHGFATWEEIWRVPEDVFPRTARCLRESILRLYNPPAEALARLVGPPFDHFVEGGPRIAYESRADVRSIDLRAADFRIARVRRKMTASNFDASRGEYSYEYTLEPE